MTQIGIGAGMGAGTETGTETGRGADMGAEMAASQAAGQAASQAAEAVAALRAKADANRLAGMARFGIATEDALGVTMPELRALARRLRREKDIDRHGLAAELWTTGIHEARILAALVDDPARVSRAQMNAWVRDFKSWDLCDQVCCNLFDKTGHALPKIHDWAKARAPFTRRAAFALAAWLAVHDKGAPDAAFRAVLPLIEAAADDGRAPVKKAVNWALRQIGKRNPALNQAAIASAERILAQGLAASDPPARWIARDALNELQSAAVQVRLKKLKKTQKKKTVAMPAKGAMQKRPAKRAKQTKAR